MSPVINMPFASCASNTPTAAVEALPTAAPNSRALGASITRTRLASSSGRTLSKLVRAASGAITASFSLPFNTERFT